MPAQRKYPDELRERAVRMVLEIRARDGRATASWPGSAASWAFIPKRCGAGSSRLRSTAGPGRAPRRRISSGSRSWSGKTVSCGGRMRS